MSQLLFILSEVGMSLHEKSHDVSGGSPSAQLLLHPVQTCHRIAFCEVTKLSASPQDQGPGQAGISGHDLGYRGLQK